MKKASDTAATHIAELSIKTAIAAHHKYPTMVEHVGELSEIIAKSYVHLLKTMTIEEFTEVRWYEQTYSQQTMTEPNATPLAAVMASNTKIAVSAIMAELNETGELAYGNAHQHITKAMLKTFRDFVKIQEDELATPKEVGEDHNTPLQSIYDEIKELAIWAAASDDEFCRYCTSLCRLAEQCVPDYMEYILKWEILDCLEFFKSNFELKEEMVKVGKTYRTLAHKPS